tara:strand:+ start:1988 stop:2260 length:273 start_codon:yes stop_codon:yes gene_type:complete
VGMKMKSKNNKFFIDCDEAKYICDKLEYNECNWWDQLKLNFRYAYCNITRSYVKRNKKLTRLINENQINCMGNKTKSDLKIKFNKELKNQ